MEKKLRYYGEKTMVLWKNNYGTMEKKNYGTMEKTLVQWKKNYGTITYLFVRVVRQLHCLTA